MEFQKQKNKPRVCGNHVFGYQELDQGFFRNFED